MRPIIVDWLAGWLGWPVADLVAPGYFTFAAIAILVGAALAVRRARQEGDDVPAVLAALSWGYFAAILGGILAPMVADLADQLISGHFVGIRWAGMVAYGGFVCGFLAAGWSLRRSGTVGFARFADLAAAPVGLAIAFVRVGCFVAGCDYGKVTSVAWAIRFPAGSPAWMDQVNAGLLPATRASSLPVHPTQLYEVALGIAIFVVVGRMGKRGPRASGLGLRPERSGAQFLTAAAMYAVGRALIEVFRGDVSRGTWGPFSTSQLIGIAVLAGCALALVRRRAVAAVATLALLALAAPARADGETGFDLGASVGATSPLNRRNGQVPELFTLGALGTYTFAEGWGVGLLYENGTNSVAIHSTFGALVSYRPPLARKLDGVVLLGLGGTSVNFRDASFTDVLAFDYRISGGLEWNFATNLSLTFTPIAFDLIQAQDLGGVIVGYQITIGLSYGTRHEPAGEPGPPPPAGAPPTPPQQQPATRPSGSPYY
jgi:prolipoprotein diacylglyceryltransferase